MIEARFTAFGIAQRFPPVAQPTTGISRKHRVRGYGAVVRSAAVALVIAFGLLLFGPVRPAAAQASYESDFIRRINSERTSRGIAAMAVDSELTGIARNWAQHMASTNTLSHNPNLANQVKQDWVKLGENVGVGDTVDAIHTAFMNSPAHRANILDGDFTKVGVGVVTGGDGRIGVAVDDRGQVHGL